VRILSPIGLTVWPSILDRTEQNRTGILENYNIDLYNMVREGASSYTFKPCYRCDNIYCKPCDFLMLKLFAFRCNYETHGVLMDTITTFNIVLHRLTIIRKMYFNYEIRIANPVIGGTNCIAKPVIFE
jgi:hypothetical protein